MFDISPLVSSKSLLMSPFWKSLSPSLCYHIPVHIPSLIAFLLLSYAQKFTLRKQVVIQVRNAASVRSLAAVLPFSSRTIYRWLTRSAIGGLAALKDRKRTGRPRKWTAEHADWLYQTVVNKTPEHYQFEFALWSVRRLRIAFREEFQITMSHSTLRRILRTLGLSPQRPKRRAVRYCPHAVTLWKSQSFPSIVQHAQETDATIVFADEAGLDSMCVYGRTWGKQGETFIVRVATSKFRVNMLAAISPQGQLCSMLHEGSVNAAVFLRFLRQLTREIQGQVIVVVDNLSIHTAKRVEEWVKDHKERVRMEFQPKYSPEVNPMELVWAWVKGRVGKMTSKTKAELRSNLEAALELLTKSPERVRKFFEEQDCQYILA